MPMPKVAPGATSELNEAMPHKSVAAAACQVTAVSHLPDGKLIIKLGGKDGFGKIGGVSSSTKILKLQESFPAELVAKYFTSVVPTGKKSPETYVEVMLNEASKQTPVTLGFCQVAVAPQLFVCRLKVFTITVSLGGQLINFGRFES